MRTISWLAGVADEVLERLTAPALNLRLPAGSVIFEQGETPSFAKLLLEGTVELLGVREDDEVLIETVHPSHFIAPSAVLYERPYLVRARVLDDARLLLVPGGAFRATVETDLALCRAMLGQQSVLLRQHIKHAKNIRLRSAEERLGCYLLNLTDQFPAGTPVKLPMEKRLIASHLAMTRETFSRAFAAMARQGFSVSGMLVTVTNAELARGSFPFESQLDGQEP